MPAGEAQLPPMLAHSGNGSAAPAPAQQAAAFASPQVVASVVQNALARERASAKAQQGPVTAASGGQPAAPAAGTAAAAASPLADVKRTAPAATSAGASSSMQPPQATSDVRGRKRQAGGGDADRHEHAPVCAPNSLAVDSCIL